MKIGIDAYYLNKPKTSMGIFQYNILINILNNYNDIEFHIFTDSYPDEFKKYKNVIFHISDFNIVKRNIYIKKILKKLDIDVFFATFNLIPLLSKKSFKIVLQNHDWSHGVLSEELSNKISGFIYKYLHKYSCIRADLNISNSKFTAGETKKYSGKDSMVIYHDADPFYKNANSKSIKPNLYIPEKYLLYVGRVFPKYKNIKSLLISYNKIIKNNDIKIIIVHSDDYRKDDYNFITENKLRIIDLKSLNMENVKYLYEHAFLTVYPSLYEGFGSPIIEAQSSGSPVLTTTYGPMPEVAGKGAIYFDGSSNDLYNKIMYIIKNENIRNDLIENGYKNSLRFSWHNTAEETMKVILNGR